MELHIKIETLKAASLMAAKNDIRYYLNGVHLEVMTGGILATVATNGHYLFFRQEAIDYDDAPPAGTCLTIPLDTVKLALKNVTKGQEIMYLVFNENGTFTLNGINFSPIDGEYPDFRRTIPQGEYKPEDGEALPDFDLEYLALAQKTLATAHGLSGLVPIVNHRGNGPAVVAYDADDCFCLVMPCRASGTRYMVVTIPEKAKLDERKAA